MISHLRTLAAYRELLWIWTQRELRVRYKQSVLGALWAILQPLSLMVMFSAIFSRMVRVPTDGIPYPVFSYTALLPWGFLATAVSFGVPSLVNNMSLVSKVFFPREVLPIASVLAAGADLLVGSIVYVGMLAAFGVRLHVSVLAVPLLLGIQAALATGIVLLAAAVSVFFRDVRFVVPLAMQLWMYASPVIYPSSLVPERLRGLYYLNPMAGVIEGYRTSILLGRWPEVGPLVLAAVTSLGVLALGYHVFKRLDRSFADVI